MNRILRAAPCAVGLVAIILGPAVQYAPARGGGGFHGGGGFSHEGGFSREGPAAGGSFASRSSGMTGREGSFQTSRQQYMSGAQASRQEYGSKGQASRQAEANTLQSNREQTARAMQSSAQEYRGSYPYVGSAWDAGAGVAATATGAVIGAATAASMTSAATGAAYTTTASCASAVAVPVEDTNYYRCGSAWYTQAYGPAGPTFISVSPPVH